MKEVKEMGSISDEGGSEEKRGEDMTWNKDKGEPQKDTHSFPTFNST